MLLAIKFIVTALIVTAVSEIAKHSGKLGALIASLPFVTILVMIWLYAEKQAPQKIADHAYYTFWYVLPTLPMFLVMPWLLGKGVNFWMSLLACMLVTFACFVLTVFVARRFGVDLMP